MINKFTADLPRMLRPSVSSSMIINLDETLITKAIVNVIVHGLTNGNKQFRKIAFVGVGKEYHNRFKELHNHTGTVVRFLDDYEQAKECVLYMNYMGSSNKDKIFCRAWPCIFGVLKRVSVN